MGVGAQSGSWGPYGLAQESSSSYASHSVYRHGLGVSKYVPEQGIEPLTHGQ